MKALYKKEGGMKVDLLRKGCKVLMAGLVVGTGFALVKPAAAEAASSVNQVGWQYNELFRNQYHYSAAKNWLNDPNGLVYDDTTNTYHMYYQYNPNGNSWGDMSWGHATSHDLINWQEQAVAIPMLDKQADMDFTFKNTTGQFTKDGKNG